MISVGDLDRLAPALRVAVAAERVGVVAELPLRRLRGVLDRYSEVADSRSVEVVANPGDRSMIVICLARLDYQDENEAFHTRKCARLHRT